LEAQQAAANAKRKAAAEKAQQQAKLAKETQRKLAEERKAQLQAEKAAQIKAKAEEAAAKKKMQAQAAAKKREDAAAALQKAKDEKEVKRKADMDAAASKKALAMKEQQRLTQKKQKLQPKQTQTPQKEKDESSTTTTTTPLSWFRPEGFLGTISISSGKAESLANNAKKETVQSTTNAKTKQVSTAAPKGVPTINRWKKLRDGSVTGLISNSPVFEDGERITTSPIDKGDFEKGQVVVTASGSKYFLG